MNQMGSNHPFPRPSKSRLASEGTSVPKVAMDKVEATTGVDAKMDDVPAVHVVFTSVDEEGVCAKSATAAASHFTVQQYFAQIGEDLGSGDELLVPFDTTGMDHHLAMPAGHWVPRFTARHTVTGKAMHAFAAIKASTSSKDAADTASQGKPSSLGTVVRMLRTVQVPTRRQSAPDAVAFRQLPIHAQHPLFAAFIETWNTHQATQSQAVLRAAEDLCLAACVYYIYETSLDDTDGVYVTRARVREMHAIQANPPVGAYRLEDGLLPTLTALLAAVKQANPGDDTLSNYELVTPHDEGARGRPVDLVVRDKGTDAKLLPRVLIEVHNERGVSGDAHAQVLGSYVKYLNATCESHSGLWVGAPRLLCTMVAEQLTVFGAVMHDRLYFEKLLSIDMVLDDTARVAAALTAVFQCSATVPSAEEELAALHSTYDIHPHDLEAVRAVPPALGHSLVFPHFNVNGYPVVLMQHLACCVYRGAYDAGTGAWRPVVATVAQRCCLQALQALSNAGHGPKLLAHEAVVWGRKYDILLTEDLRVAGYVPLCTPLNADVPVEDQRYVVDGDDARVLADKIRSCLATLHDQGLVFCDLREPKVMVRRDPTSRRVVDVRLIDAEFAGKAGTPWPSVRYNMSIAWPEDVLKCERGAGRDWPLRKASHDEGMLLSLMGRVGPADTDVDDATRSSHTLAEGDDVDATPTASPAAGGAGAGAGAGSGQS